MTDYLSPAVLDIVSPRELSKELMQLSGNFLRKGVGEHAGRSWQRGSAVTSTVLSSGRPGGPPTQVSGLDLGAQGPW